MNSVDLSIIVVSYNTREHLQNCIRNVLSHMTRHSIEVIVVDNASHDGSAEMVAVSFPKVNLIRNDYNYGFAAATNQGFAASRGRYVMTLNPDTELLPSVVDELLGSFETCADIALACSVSCCPQQSAGPICLPWHRVALFDQVHSFRLMRRQSLPIASSKPIEVSQIRGTGYVCRRDAIQRDKLFSEDLFLFGEEYELCCFLRGKGGKLVIVPTARIVHHTSVTFKRNGEALAVARKLGTAAEWRIKRHRYGVALALVLQAVTCCDALFLWGCVGIKRLFFGRTVDRALMQTDYCARASASLWLLLCRDAYVERINEHAKMFFNNGVAIPAREPALQDSALSTQ